MNNVVSFVTKLLKVKRVSSALIIMTALISAVIIFVTIYSSQVGNFIISAAQQNKYKISLSETPDFENPVTALTAPGVKNMTHCTLSWIDLELIQSINGSANSSVREYLAYSFYLRNDSEVIIDYNIRLIIESVYKNVLDAAWTLVIETRGDVSTQTIYARGQNRGLPENSPLQPETGDGTFETTMFASNINVLNYNVKNLRVGETVRYTFVIWLEGEDPECVDAILEGSMRLNLQFTALDPED